MKPAEDCTKGFHGVYLLFSHNKRFRGRTYIGYTVNPSRRIMQHNKGKEFGGARKTSDRGPWEMVLIIHGFQSEVAGLQFEWAWQHPDSSRFLKQLQIPNRKSTNYEARLRVMWTMLRISPWKRHPLTIRWLSVDLVQEPPPLLQPPPHMPIVHGDIAEDTTRVSAQCSSVSGTCSLCLCAVSKEEDRVTCVNEKACQSSFHVLCLADAFLAEENCCDSQLIPLEGNCPVCKANVLWGDIVKRNNTSFA